MFCERKTKLAWVLRSGCQADFVDTHSIILRGGGKGRSSTLWCAPKQTHFYVAPKLICLFWAWEIYLTWIDLMILEMCHHCRLPADDQGHHSYLQQHRRLHRQQLRHRLRAQCETLPIFVPLSGFSQHLICRRRRSRLPFQIPRGWFAACFPVAGGREFLRYSRTDNPQIPLI